jgi:hypothetical protein
MAGRPATQGMPTEGQPSTTPDPECHLLEWFRRLHELSARSSPRAARARDRREVPRTRHFRQWSHSSSAIKGRCSRTTSRARSRSARCRRSSSSSRSLTESDPWPRSIASRVECFSTIRMTKTTNSNSGSGT